MRLSFRSAAAGAAALSLALTACSSDGSPASSTASGTAGTPVTVVLDWTPNTNHTGIYVAKAKGYFTAQGLDVTIVEPPEDGAEALVGAGKAQFGVSYQENVTQARAQDVPVVSVAAVVAHNTSGFASNADRGLTRPKDYDGHTYGGWGSPIEGAILDTVVSKDGGDPSTIKNVNIGTTSGIQALQQGSIDLIWTYEAWDVKQAELAGQDLSFQRLTDIDPDLDWYTPVFISNEDTIATNPELVQKFVNAVTQGYQDAIIDPAGASDILIAAAPDLDPDLVRASQEYLAAEYQSDSPQWGYQKDSIWKGFTSWLEENKVIDAGFDWESAYTNQFVDAVPADLLATGTPSAKG